MRIANDFCTKYACADILTPTRYNLNNAVALVLKQKIENNVRETIEKQQQEPQRTSTEQKNLPFQTEQPLHQRKDDDVTCSSYSGPSKVEHGYDNPKTISGSKASKSNAALVEGSHLSIGSESKYKRLVGKRSAMTSRNMSQSFQNLNQKSEASSNIATTQSDNQVFDRLYSLAKRRSASRNRNDSQGRSASRNRDQSAHKRSASHVKKSSMVSKARGHENIGPGDRLYYMWKVRTDKIKRQKDDLDRQRALQEMDETTFAPRINKKSDRLVYLFL